MDLKRIFLQAQLGDPIVILDDLREFEGDIYCPAETITVEVLQFMVRKGSGLLCLAMPRLKLEEMGIPRLSEGLGLLSTFPKKTLPESWARFFSSYRPADTPFHLPIDRKGLRSGISVSDRYATIRALLEPYSSIEQFEVPGHLATLGSHPQGLAGRKGHTESAVALAEMADLAPAGVLCEIVGNDGDMCIGEDLQQFIEENGLSSIRISDLLQFVGSTMGTLTSL